MSKPSVLVSGGAGYIGSHTAVELIRAGYDVVIVDNLSNSEIGAVEGVRRITGVEVPFIEADCCDAEAFRKVFEQYPFDSVIHFAASKAVNESAHKPLEYYRNNLTSFMNVIALMREYGRHNIVFSSSCTVYGEPDKQPVTEQTPRKPATSPYGNTKQMCEDILRDSVGAYEGMKGIALRYFNPIGAHPSALIGELPRGVPQNLVPYITQTAAGIRECLSVFGDDYPTPDGSCIRDYIDVVDLARAHVAAIGRMIEERIRQAKEISDVCVVNIHWGNEYTHVPTERQRYLAGKLSEWGADLIIGHHPHVIQPIEYIEREDGSRTLVAYSLGNFISAQDSGARMIGGMLDVDIAVDLETGKTEFNGCRFVPDFGGDPATFYLLATRRGSR